MKYSGKSFATITDSDQNNDNLSNHHNRDEEMQTCRIWCKKDICENALFYERRYKLMFTNMALIFLIVKFVFAIFTELFGAAFWAAIWYNFIREILSPFSDFHGGTAFRGKTIITLRNPRSQLSFNLTKYIQIYGGKTL